MKIIKDNKGRSYELTINIAQVKRVRDILGEDLLDITSAFDRLNHDLIFFVDVLYVVLKKECDKHGINDEEFGESMFGDAIGDAQKAFMEELVGFFPNAAAREAAEAVIGRYRKLQEELRKQGMEAMEQEDIPEKARTIMKILSGTGSTNSPESPESTPTPSPSEA